MCWGCKISLQQRTHQGYQFQRKTIVKSGYRPSVQAQIVQEQLDKSLSFKRESIDCKSENEYLMQNLDKLAQQVQQCEAEQQELLKFQKQQQETIKAYVEEAKQLTLKLKVLNEQQNALFSKINEERNKCETFTSKEPQSLQDIKLTLLNIQDNSDALNVRQLLNNSYFEKFIQDFQSDYSSACKRVGQCEADLEKLEERHSAHQKLINEIQSRLQEEQPPLHETILPSVFFYKHVQKLRDAIAAVAHRCKQVSAGNFSKYAGMNEPIQINLTEEQSK